MNGFDKEDKSRCFFHPDEQVIGVCPFCLNDRLLIIASSTKGRHGFIQGFSHKKLPINKLPKIFALSSLLNRRKSRNSDDDDLDVSTSQEDSFISIKFEENGVASWEKGNVKSKVSIEDCSKSLNPTLTKEITKEPKVTNKSVIEHAKPCVPLRWRKRIGLRVPAHQVEEVQQGQHVPHGKQGKWNQLYGEGVDKDSDKEDQRIKSVHFFA